ncbi:UDP-glucose 4-epimerase GalE [Camelimonas lactis]|uniref:UDP-glucose 4-epimerase n=1 Tax=Camelimonas lactis TaxID=659006 RepID=A0A4R2GXX2_9HYPH|nr:UDP-glucose 4-epimerase GalE [Camelimonas lactis]TCO15887.1 UDP-glucose 4-epimerase [Camelimonas lactis]
MSNTRVIVTGGAGYIGSHTLIELLIAGYEVCVVDNFVNSSPESLKRVARLSSQHFRVERADIRDACAVTAIFRAFQPDAVIHFAGLKAVGEGETLPLEYYDVNVGGTLNLLRAMTGMRPPAIIFSSSATVYGDPDYLPIDEQHPTRPASVYGRTKLIAEDVLRDWARATPGARAVMLRYFNPVGAHDSGDIGEDPQGPPNNLMPFIAQVAVGLRDRLAIFGGDYDTRDGTGLRDYIHVVDLARAHVAALNYASTCAPGSDVFNIGTGYGATVREILQAYERACCKTLPYHIVPRRPGDVAASVADPTRAITALNWRAELGINDMCQSSWKWQSRNPRGFQFGVDVTLEAEAGS